MLHNNFSSSESRFETFMSFVEMGEYVYGLELHEMTPLNNKKDGSIDGACEVVEKSECVSSEEIDDHVSYSSLYDTVYSEGSSSNIQRSISDTDLTNWSSDISESSSLNNLLLVNPCQCQVKSNVYNADKMPTTDVVYNLVYDKFKNSIDRLEMKKKSKRSFRDIRNLQNSVERIDNDKLFRNDIKPKKKTCLNSTESSTYNSFMISACDTNNTTVEYAEPFEYGNRSLINNSTKDSLYDEPLIHKFQSHTFKNIKNNIKRLKKYLTKCFTNVPPSPVEVQAFIYSQSSANRPSTSSYANSGSTVPVSNVNSDDATALTMTRSPSSGSQYSNEYNEIDFIQTALGDELRQDEKANIFRRSVDTDNISYLLSSDSTINENRKNTLKRPLTNRKNLFSNYRLNKRRTIISVNESYASYEDITSFYQDISSDRKRTEIKNKIYVHESVMEQAERALRLGLGSRKFNGSPAHLEIERVLLVSNIRKQALTNILYSLPEVTEVEGKLKIENLKCAINMPKSNNLEREQYYMCVLRYRGTVFITKVISPNRLGSVNFGGCFIFDDLPNTFNIKLELYALLIPKPSHKCFDIPFWTHTARLPMVRLIGETNIGIVNRKNKRFPLNCLHESVVHADISASISTTIKWPKTLRGFVTIGISKDEHPAIWNRRWCVLEEGKLTYYNYPSDEDYNKPVGYVNMEYCKSCEESAQKYLWQKTLLLFADDGHEYKSYFLSPDSSDDLALWQKRIQMTLKLIGQWNMF